jgi:hypothetical protein
MVKFLAWNEDKVDILPTPIMYTILKIHNSDKRMPVHLYRSRLHIKQELFLTAPSHHPANNHEIKRQKTEQIMALFECCYMEKLQGTYKEIW